jgi:hypothetical protein
MNHQLRHPMLAVLLAGVAACGRPATADSAAGGSASPATGAATPSAAAPAPVPAGPVSPGGTIEHSAGLTVGTSVEGEIAKADQNDFYRFDNPLKQRDLGIVRLQNRSATLKPYFKLFNADRSGIAENYDGTPGASVERVIALEPGQAFYIEVLNYGSAGKYTLSVTPQKAYDAHEPDDDVLTASAVAIGTPIDASIMDDKDADWYRISGATQKTAHVIFDNQSTTLRPYVKMFSASKSAIGEKYDGTPGANLDFTFDVEPGKDFYVQVVPYGSTGKYRLTVKSEPPR